jgi:hypothetical protein
MVNSVDGHMKDQDFDREQPELEPLGLTDPLLPPLPPLGYGWLDFALWVLSRQSESEEALDLKRFRDIFNFLDINVSASAKNLNLTSRTTEKHQQKGLELNPKKRFPDSTTAPLYAGLPSNETLPSHDEPIQENSDSLELNPDSSESELSLAELEQTPLNRYGSPEQEVSSDQAQSEDVLLPIVQPKDTANLLSKPLQKEGTLLPETQQNLDEFNTTQEKIGHPPSSTPLNPDAKNDLGQTDQELIQDLSQPSTLFNNTSLLQVPFEEDVVDLAIAPLVSNSHETDTGTESIQNLTSHEQHFDINEDVSRAAVIEPSNQQPSEESHESGLDLSSEETIKQEAIAEQPEPSLEETTEALGAESLNASVLHETLENQAEQTIDLGENIQDRALTETTSENSSDFAPPAQRSSTPEAIDLQRDSGATVLQVYETAQLNENESLQIPSAEAAEQSILDISQVSSPLPTENTVLQVVQVSKDPDGETSSSRPLNEHEAENFIHPESRAEQTTPPEDNSDAAVNERLHLSEPTHDDELSERTVFQAAPQTHPNTVSESSLSGIPGDRPDSLQEESNLDRARDAEPLQIQSLESPVIESIDDNYVAIPHSRPGSLLPREKNTPDTISEAETQEIALSPQPSLDNESTPVDSSAELNLEPIMDVSMPMEERSNIFISASEIAAQQKNLPAQNALTEAYEANQPIEQLLPAQSQDAQNENIAEEQLGWLARGVDWVKSRLGSKSQSKEPLILADNQPLTQPQPAATDSDETALLNPFEETLDSSDVVAFAENDIAEPLVDINLPFEAPAAVAQSIDQPFSISNAIVTESFNVANQPVIDSPQGNFGNIESSLAESASPEAELQEAELQEANTIDSKENKPDDDGESSSESLDIAKATDDELILGLARQPKKDLKKPLLGESSSDSHPNTSGSLSSQELSSTTLNTDNEEIGTPQPAAQCTQNQSSGIDTDVTNPQEETQIFAVEDSVSPAEILAPFKEQETSLNTDSSNTSTPQTLKNQAAPNALWNESRSLASDLETPEVLSEPSTTIDSVDAQAKTEQLLEPQRVSTSQPKILANQPSASVSESATAQSIYARRESLSENVLLNSDVPEERLHETPQTDNNASVQISSVEAAPSISESSQTPSPLAPEKSFLQVVRVNEDTDEEENFSPLSNEHETADSIHPESGTEPPPSPEDNSTAAINQRLPSFEPTHDDELSERTVLQVAPQTQPTNVEPSSVTEFPSIPESNLSGIPGDRQAQLQDVLSLDDFSKAEPLQTSLDPDTIQPYPNGAEEQNANAVEQVSAPYSTSFANEIHEELIADSEDNSLKSSSSETSWVATNATNQSRAINPDLDPIQSVNAPTESRSEEKATEIANNFVSSDPIAKDVEAGHQESSASMEQDRAGVEQPGRSQAQISVSAEPSNDQPPESTTTKAAQANAISAFYPLDPSEINLVDTVSTHPLNEQGDINTSERQKSISSHETSASDEGLAGRTPNTSDAERLEDKLEDPVDQTIALGSTESDEFNENAIAANENKGIKKTEISLSPELENSSSNLSILEHQNNFEEREKKTSLENRLENRQARQTTNSSPELSIASQLDINIEHPQILDTDVSSQADQDLQAKPGQKTSNKIEQPPENKVLISQPKIEEIGLQSIAKISQGSSENISSENLSKISGKEEEDLFDEVAQSEIRTESPADARSISPEQDNLKADSNLRSDTPKTPFIKVPTRDNRISTSSASRHEFEITESSTQSISIESKTFKENPKRFDSLLSDADEFSEININNKEEILKRNPIPETLLKEERKVIDQDQNYKESLLDSEIIDTVYNIKTSDIVQNITDKKVLYEEYKAPIDRQFEDSVETLSQNSIVQENIEHSSLYVDLSVPTNEINDSKTEPELEEKSELLNSAQNSSFNAQAKESNSVKENTLCDQENLILQEDTSKVQGRSVDHETVSLSNKIYSLEESIEKTEVSVLSNQYSQNSVLEDVSEYQVNTENSNNLDLITNPKKNIAIDSEFNLFSMENSKKTDFFEVLNDTSKITDKTSEEWMSTFDLSQFQLSDTTDNWSNVEELINTTKTISNLGSYREDIEHSVNPRKYWTNLTSQIEPREEVNSSLEKTVSVETWENLSDLIQKLNVNTLNITDVNQDELEIKSEESEESKEADNKIISNENIAYSRIKDSLEKQSESTSTIQAVSQQRFLENIKHQFLIEKERQGNLFVNQNKIQKYMNKLDDNSDSLKIFDNSYLKKIEQISINTQEVEELFQDNSDDWELSKQIDYSLVLERERQGTYFWKKRSF